ncbi:PqqD family protein [Chloroflexi bacterium TSY]|nr:PqqD family protein [Chloroflexi bacterium TSY]
MNNHSKPLRNPEILVQELGEETLLFDTNGKVIHILNPSAQYIWHLCDGEHALDEIEQAMRNRFEIKTKYDVAADIQRTLADLAQKELVRLTDAMET